MAVAFWTVFACWGAMTIIAFVLRWELRQAKEDVETWKDKHRAERIKNLDLADQLHEKSKGAPTP